MAFQKKYFFDYYRLGTTEKHTVEIWQDTGASITAEEITGMASPLVVDLPDLDSVFQVVRGKGCSLTLLSQTDGQFFDSLYHVNPCEIKLIHKVNDTIENVFYLDSEMMQEPFDQNKNYPVNITGNDGLGLMDRFSFLQPDATKYEGIKSKIEILQIILNKIGLWNAVGLDLSTSFDYPNAFVESILHESFVDCANFYDEDDKPMSLREVAESILAPYGAHMETKGERVLISDTHTKATKTTLSYLMFSLIDLSMQVSLSVANIREISVASYMGTGAGKERSGGVNRQVVSYSPYPIKSIMEESLTGVDEFTGVPTTFLTKDGYKYKELTGNTFWEIDDIKQVITNYSSFEASYYTDEKDTNVYLRRPTYTDDQSIVARCIVNPWLSIAGARAGEPFLQNGHIRYRTKYTTGVAFLITGELLAKTKNNPYADGKSPVEITEIGIMARLKVGDYYFDPSVNSWTKTPTKFYIYSNDPGRQAISDRFVQMGRNGGGFKALVGSLSANIVLNGNFEFELYTSFKHNTQTDITYVQNSALVKEIWMKNISVKLINYDGSEISDSDIEYIGLLDKNFQNEGETVQLTTGTDAQFSDRGKIMQYDGDDYSSVKMWTRNGQTNKIEKLLLNSLCSNFKSGMITLNNMKLKADFPLHTIFTDPNLPGVKLMVKSAIVDYYENRAECTMTEIQADQLTIIDE